MAAIGKHEIGTYQALSQAQAWWESNLLPFTVGTLTVRVRTDFIYFVLHYIYILDCYQIFTRLDLIF